MRGKTKPLVFVLLLIPAVLSAQLQFVPDPGFEGWEFPDTPVGGVSVIELRIFSLNDEDFQEVTIQIGNDPDMEGGFAVEPDNAFVLEPGGANNIALLFSPGEVGRYEAAIEFRVISNDPEDPGIIYPYELSGQGVEIRPPRMEVEPGEIELWFITGENGRIETETEITITNTGEGLLRIEQIVIDEDWLMVDRDNFTVEPGEEAAVTVSVVDPRDIDLGDYQATVTILSNDPENDEIDIPVTFTRDRIIWDPPRTLEFHSVLIIEARIDGELLELGDMIGVFTPGNVLAGAVEVENPAEPFPVGLAAWGDDPGTPEIEGFINNEVMSFRLWDMETDEIYNAEPVYQAGDGNWMRNGFSALAELNSVPREDSLVVELIEGWNMISSNRDFFEEYCDDGDPAMHLILEEVMDEIVVFKNLHGLFSIPDMDYWMFRNWDVSQSYLIKVSEDVNLVIHGDPVVVERAIELTEGWNMISYYPGYESRFENACARILDHVIIGKDGYGVFWTPNVHLPELNMIPGNGYLVKVSEDCQLQYPLEDPDDDQVASIQSGYGSPIHFSRPTRTDHNMSLIIESIVDINTFDAFEIACFNGIGRCVGVTGVNSSAPWGMAVWGDDNTTEEIDGLNTGERLGFRLWDAATGSEYSLEVTDDSEVTYRKNDVRRIELASTDAVSAILPESERLCAFTYPNPFNGVTTLHISGTQNNPATVSVYDLSGRVIDEIKVKPAMSGFQSIPLNMGMLPNGIYLIKVQNGHYCRMIRTLLLK